jgi:Raf kinase inhibitor-like YbhB/YbcL family protein
VCDSGGLMKLSHPVFRAGLAAGLTAFLVSMVTGCGNDSDPPDQAETTAQLPSTIQVSSSVFEDGEAIAPGYSCDGTNSSPPLKWKGVPDDTAALALVMSDPDAPNGTFYHWIVTDIPPDSTGFELGATPDGVVAQNSTGQSAYLGPCPPSGTHHYRFTVYALDMKVGLTEGADTTRALNAIRQAAVAEGTLVGTYTRA